jgi:hypothetical protein
MVRATALVVGLALVVESAATADASATPLRDAALGVVKVSPKSGSGPSEAVDVPSARVAARLWGKRVEALAERTETSTTWANPDGTLTTEMNAGPVWTARR